MQNLKQSPVNLTSHPAKAIGEKPKSKISKKGPVFAFRGIFMIKALSHSQVKVLCRFTKKVLTTETQSTQRKI